MLLHIELEFESFVGGLGILRFNASHAAILGWVVLCDTHVSILTPHGRDQPEGFCAGLGDVSIHAPARGATRTNFQIPGNILNLARKYLLRV